MKKPPSHLSSIVQREKESLKMYVQKFTEAMMQIKGESDECAMQIMRDGLINEDFIRAISRNPP